MTESVEFKINMIGLAYMAIAVFGHPFAMFICFALFIAVVIILKDEVERLYGENYILKNPL